MGERLAPSTDPTGFEGSVLTIYQLNSLITTAWLINAHKQTSDRSNTFTVILKINVYLFKKKITSGEVQSEENCCVCNVA